MTTELSTTSSNGLDRTSISVEQIKIIEVRRLLGSSAERAPLFCSDACISRYLNAHNWNVKKATKMLKETLKWRLTYRPEEIRWEEVAQEAQTGKIYRTNYVDKHGRTVLVMRPSCQNSKSTKGQIKYLVYCMENAILNLPPGQEQMVWLIDFEGFSLSHISIRVTRETAHVLQDHYPERLGLAVLYNAPKFFEPFYTVVKPFLEPKTYNKVKFVYSSEGNTGKPLEDLFDMNQLESAFGGKSNAGFDINTYADRMREDDKKACSFWARTDTQAPTEVHLASTIPLTPTNSGADSDASGKAASDVGLRSAAPLSPKEAGSSSDGCDEKTEVSHGTDLEVPQTETICK